MDTKGDLEELVAELYKRGFSTAAIKQYITDVVDASNEALERVEELLIALERKDKSEGYTSPEGIG